MDKIKQKFLKFCTFLGFSSILLGSFSLCVWIIFFSSTKPDVPQSAILHFNLSGGISEQRHVDQLQEILNGTKLLFRDLLVSLHRAKKDDRVKAVSIRIDYNSLGIAQAEELRLSLKDFRVSGKKVFLYTDSFGELSSGLKNYYLASVADEIWMSPAGVLNIMGFYTEIPFFKALLDKIGVHFEVIRRENYKGLMDQYTHKTMPLEFQKTYQYLMKSFSDHLFGTIAFERKIKPETMLFLRDDSPILPQETLKHGLITKLGYFDELKEHLKGIFGKNTKPISFKQYLLATEKKPARDASKIALIYAVGEIEKGIGRPEIAEDVIDDRIMIATLDEAMQNDAVKAIVLRIDSPGGSAIASETLWRAIYVCKKKKPVIVSVGNMAASGGYMMACAADFIYSLETSIVGSIGTILAKPYAGEILKTLDLHFGTIQVGKNADMESMIKPFSKSVRQKLEDLSQASYMSFLQKIVEGRKISLEKLMPLAGGRVWTGRDAKRFGLVDDIGGLSYAIQKAREMAHISQDKEIDIEILPYKRSVTEKLLSAFLGSGSSEDDEEAEVNLLASFIKNIWVQMKMSVDQWLLKSTSVRAQSSLDHNS